MIVNITTSVLIALNIHFLIFMELYPVQIIQKSPGLDHIKIFLDMNKSDISNSTHNIGYNLWMCYAREYTAYFRFINFVLPW